MQDDDAFTLDLLEAMLPARVSLRRGDDGIVHASHGPCLGQGLCLREALIALLPHMLRRLVQGGAPSTLPPEPVPPDHHQHEARAIEFALQTDLIAPAERTYPPDICPRVTCRSSDIDRSTAPGLQCRVCGRIWVGSNPEET